MLRVVLQVLQLLHQVQLEQVLQIYYYKIQAVVKRQAQELT